MADDSESKDKAHSKDLEKSRSESDNKSDHSHRIDESRWEKITPNSRLDGDPTIPPRDPKPKK